MAGLYFLLPTLLVIFVSFLIIRAAAVALMMTGMDENWIPIPKPKETIRNGDKLVVYGSLHVLKGIFSEKS